MTTPPTDPTRLSRRNFLTGTAGCLGMAALSELLNSALNGDEAAPADVKANGLPHFPPTAKRVILLWQGGGASQVDLFDHKPGLEALRLTELPESVRGGTRLSTMTANQKHYPILPAHKPFKQYGQSGMFLSEMLPHLGSMSDEICVVRSMQTESVNHAPGVTNFMTGSQIPGRPSMGAWVSYGLGSAAKDLPDFVVLTSADAKKTCGQLFYEHYWGSGFIPSQYQGVRFRSEGDPVLYISDPPGMSRGQKRDMLDDLAAMNGHRLATQADPEIATRIAQYEMAFKMQMSVPDLLDLGNESPQVLDSYGPDVRKPGTFASHCLLARRLAERGVRFIQVMHSGWDQHSNLSTQLSEQCIDTDQPSAALLRDLKQRGLLDDTLVIWCTEFGRTVFVQGDISNPTGHGRDHFGRAFSIWMAGGGVKRGHVYGETDDFSYHVVKDPMPVHDWQATVLHLLGIDHQRLTFRYQGRQFRLTDVAGTVASGIIA